MKPKPQSENDATQVSQGKLVLSVTQGCSVVHIKLKKTLFWLSQNL